MDVIVESHIPFIEGVLEQYGHRVTYLPPEMIDREAVKTADALVVRTRTKVNSALLSGSTVSHVVTATIGTDHIDAAYCAANSIAVDNAPGCNAPAVAQYVLASIAAIFGKDNLTGLTLGIVGVGHVGKIVARWAEANGLKLMLCDPPRALAECSDQFVSLDQIAAGADVVTFHTPLDDTTRHICGSDFLSKLRNKPVIINAARGPVVDTEALIRALELGTVRAVVIDCWENEPDISPRLLRLAAIATPHIAGYSAEGKLRATAMSVKALDPRIDISMPPVADEPSVGAIVESYDPVADTMALKRDPDAFELLRNSYCYRSEPS